MKTYIQKIKLAETSPYGDGLKPVEVHTNDGNYHLFKIEELLELLRLWIIGEEEKYPQPQCRGRWMLFDEIKKVFDEEITENVQNNTKITEEKQTKLAH